MHFVQSETGPLLQLWMRPKVQIEVVEGVEMVVPELVVGVQMVVPEFLHYARSRQHLQSFGQRQEGYHQNLTQLGSLSPPFAAFRLPRHF